MFAVDKVLRSSDQDCWEAKWKAEDSEIRIDGYNVILIENSGESKALRNKIDDL